MSDFFIDAMQAERSKTIPFSPNTDIPSLRDKVILITGANSGLGKQTALELVQHEPQHIWMAARNAVKGEAAVADVQTKAPANTNAKVSFLELDLASFESIKRAVSEVLSATKRLDLLFLNAGILGTPAGMTEEGYEIQMGTNHIGHALLLKLLSPMLSNTATMEKSRSAVRVVSLTSIGGKWAPSPGISFHKLKSPNAEERSIVRYMQSKLANLLYAREASKHYTNFTIVSVHPGEADTELFKREAGDEEVLKLLTDVAPLRVKPVEECVLNQLWASVAEEVVSGKYYEPVGVPGEESGFALDQELAAKLWDWTGKELRGHETEKGVR